MAQNYVWLVQAKESFNYSAYGAAYFPKPHLNRQERVFKSKTSAINYASKMASKGYETQIIKIYKR